MTTIHTSGPWKFAATNKFHGEYVVFSPGEVHSSDPDFADAIIAEIAGGLGAYSDGCCESEANARLIAAAPDLLAALKSLEDILGTLLESGRIVWTRDDAPIIHARIEEAREAIANARD